MSGVIAMGAPWSAISNGKRRLVARRLAEPIAMTAVKRNPDLERLSIEWAYGEAPLANASPAHDVTPTGGHMTVWKLFGAGLLGLLFCRPLAAEPAKAPVMPMAHSNNAVARLVIDGRTHFFSFMGIREGKTFADISKQAFELDLHSGKWRSLPDVPVAQGRLASAAVGLNGRIYLFGGYTVAADGTEVSTPDLFAFDPRTGSYSVRAPIPVPVDDSVALPFEGRYIYLVSGWHEKDNVRLVQVYDTKDNRWFRATDWPGAAVFGHAGGIVGNRMVIADGVAVLPGVTGRARFKLVDGAWLGEIDAGHPKTIKWKRLPPHPGAPLYRIAATGTSKGDRVVFAGGSETAYNYNGDGYDGTPARPSARSFAFDFRTGKWVDYGAARAASMDHRGLLEAGGRFYTIGGMGEGARVVGDVTAFTVPTHKRN